MSAGRRTFQRPFGERRYRRRFIIAVEGALTEPQYFALLDDQDAAIRVKCLESKSNSDPSHVLKRMKKFLKTESLQGTDEAWLVVDRDSWPETTLDELWKWSTEKAHRGFALSNPCFEYWLLLHFEDGSGLSSRSEVITHLKRHFPDYDKAVGRRAILKAKIEAAVSRARGRDVPPCATWPRTFGVTTVYRLVEKIRGG